MKKIVMKLDLHDNKEKQKAMKAVSRLAGIDSIAMDMKEKKLSVVGGVDPVDVVNKLRKYWHTEIVSVGPEKEAEKKKEEPKKEVVEKKVAAAEPKKMAESEKKKDPGEQQVSDLVRAYQAYNPHMTTHYYVQSAEENPNACVIC